MTDSPVDRDLLIEQGLAAGVGSEDVTLWSQGGEQRDQAEFHLIEKLHGWAARMDKLEKGLAENTASTARVETNTAAIVEAFESLRGAMNVLQAIGKIARPLSYIAMAGSAIVGLFYAVKGGGSGVKP
jgi:hypothetical protein